MVFLFNLTYELDLFFSVVDVFFPIEKGHNKLISIISMAMFIDLRVNKKAFAKITFHTECLNFNETLMILWHVEDQMQRHPTERTI